MYPIRELPPVRKFSFSVIRFRSSLLPNEGNDIPLAVIVELRSKEQSCLLGHMPELPPDSTEFSRQLIKNVPSFVNEQVRQSKSKQDGDSIIEILTKSNRWNLYFTEVQEFESEREITDVAIHLFNKYVDTLSAKIVKSIKRLEPITKVSTIPKHTDERNHEIFLQQPIFADC